MKDHFLGVIILESLSGFQRIERHLYFLSSLCILSVCVD
jgi:hypothetical protein